MNFDIAKHTIFLTLHGSYAYGMSNESSDVDVKGIAISPKEYYLGFINKFNQFEGIFPKDYIINGKTYVKILEGLVGRKIPDGEKIDSVIFEIKKFFYLASNCNPNIIEILFTDKKHHILKTKLGQKLLDNKELFLSQKAKFTFSGFAFSQLKRIKSHRAWLLNPIEIKPKRSDYGLPEYGLISGDQRRAAEALIRRKIESWLYIPDELPKDVLSSVRKNTISSILDMWKGLVGDCYIKKENNGETLFELLKPPLNSFGDFDTEKLEHAASVSLSFDSNFIQALDMERKYKGALRNYNQYQEWKKNRNPKRAELEAKYSFDCYSYDTEFLTRDGWKKFDDIIETDKLATVYIGEDLTNKVFGNVRFENFTDKFDALYNGNMYHFKGYHTDVLVTSNHRMLYRYYSRKNNLPGNIMLKEASNMPDSFEFLRTITPKENVFCNENIINSPILINILLHIMGWYLSDGIIHARKNKNDIRYIVRISQKKGGRLHGSMVKFHNKYKDILNSSLYMYDRLNLSGQKITEVILSITNKEVCNFIKKECGRLRNKHIPRWVFNLSRRLMEVLFDAMCLGDGTVRNTSKRSWIYYSTLKQLANDVNELAFYCGWETSFWGPYASIKLGKESIMYQVHVYKFPNQFQKFNRRYNIEKFYVNNYRVVCFSVPNGILITRRNGRIGIHGNCKHASHLARLLKMCNEIITLGEVNVYRSDADELLAIRNGSWTYDYLINWAEEKQKELDEFYKSNKSPLPKYPNIKKIDDLCQEIIEESFKEKLNY